MNDKSCVKCKFLYSEGSGYSNYTWLETLVCCALGKNPNLPAGEPYDWIRSPDNWPKTSSSRCEMYSESEGDMVALDVAGEDCPEDYTKDEEAIEAIHRHCRTSRGKNKGSLMDALINYRSHRGAAAMGQGVVGRGAEPTEEYEQKRSEEISDNLDLQFITVAKEIGDESSVCWE